MAFEPGPELGSPRQACAAVILDDSRILVAGGLSGNGRLCSTEVLDVRTTSFAPGPDMPAARSGCAAVRRWKVGEDSGGASDRKCHLGARRRFARAHHRRGRCFRHKAEVHAPLRRPDHGLFRGPGHADGALLVRRREARDGARPADSCRRWL
ncbi:hypothetical protein M885DRAFT_507899 [Pelagophyceae sp. CCMP2097]|nr:hypothetical protein M885DRAFT_507899 [Pelagophyceae sp. CCMP2097]